MRHRTTPRAPIINAKQHEVFFIGLFFIVSKRGLSFYLPRKHPSKPAIPPSRQRKFGGGRQDALLS